MRAGRSTAVSLAMVLAAAGLGGCGGGGDAGGATRQVLVDYSSDEFASFALLNFPEKITVRQGDTVQFKQTWTGEPHTVTGGTTINELLTAGQGWLDFFDAFEAMRSSGVELPDPENPGKATAGDFAKAFLGAEDEELRAKGVAGWNALVAMDIGLSPLDPASTQPFAEIVEIVETKSDEFFADIPSAFDDDDQLAQNVSQPCFRDQGGPPEDTDEACAKADQRQPEFTGRQSYYNSGVIPYQGDRSNTYEVKIADDAAPGSYLFYCAVHGFGQKSEVEIVAEDAEIPDQSAVNRAIREETKSITADLRTRYRDAQDGSVTLPGADEPLEGPFAGLPGEEEHSAINEFLPKVITAKAGEPITWKMMGADHSISFNVPRYFPIMEFLEDGTVRINPKLVPAAGGAVAYEPPDDEGEGEDGGGEDGEGEGGPPSHDGGTFDGTGFWSSGLIGAQPYLEYTMRITKPGTYAYACLLHPPMVGQIKVTA